MIDATTALPDGSRLRIRLPQARDVAGVATLHGHLGVEASRLDVARTLRFDPRRSTVAVATALVDRREAVVAYAAMDHGTEAPHLLVTHPDWAPHAAHALTAVLRHRTAGRHAA